MANEQVAVLQTGLVTSVGLNAAATCAAIRAQVRCPSRSRFVGRDGEWIAAHQVALASPAAGVPRLARLLNAAIAEIVSGPSVVDWSHTPLVLCLSEADRPHRTANLDERLVTALSAMLGFTLDARSVVIAQGRVAVAFAIQHARRLLDRDTPHVLIAAVDSYVEWPFLARLEEDNRLLVDGNSNGFMPGEAAGALLLGRGTPSASLTCDGVGFGVEKATIASDLPSRAEGMTDAIRTALADAGCRLDEVDYRITGLSGEHHFFREDAIAVARTLERRKDTFDVWHPAECIGEVGAVSGIACIAVAEAAARKGYAPGDRVLVQLASDASGRAALVLRDGRRA